MLTDADLLRRYVEEKAEGAFAELVRRHLNLVYAAALRRTNGRHALAEEIAQKVFTGVARKAAYLTDHPTLTGWLYRSTRNVAIDTIRIELRREKLARALTVMPDELFSADSFAELDQLRPFIDEAMDQLKERDREIMLLRFFQGLNFAQVGARLNLTENNARMRTERALEKLRVQLGKRGITSTAALASLLTSQSLVAAPASLAASVTTTALAAVPVGALTLFVTQLTMNKIAMISLSASLAAALTSVAWAAVADPVHDAQLAALRSENARLTQATAAESSSASVSAVADEFATQASSIIQAVGKRVEQRNATGADQYHNYGQATARDTFLTYGWALYMGDSAVLSKILAFDEPGKENIQTLYAGMPASIRAQFHTPEDLVVFLFIAHTLLQPVPGMDVAEKFVATETSPGHVAMSRPGIQGGMNLIQTPEGWKCVVPAALPGFFAQQVLGNEMLAKLGRD